jgi:hypothetical protein
MSSTPKAEIEIKCMLDVNHDSSMKASVSFRPVVIGKSGTLLSLYAVMHASLTLLGSLPLQYHTVDEREKERQNLPSAGMIFRVREIGGGILEFLRAMSSGSNCLCSLLGATFFLVILNINCTKFSINFFFLAGKYVGQSSELVNVLL